MIGKRIKARREQLNMTQEELAKKLGYKSKSSINKIELDKTDISRSKLIQFANVLDVEPTYFIESIEHPIVTDDRVRIFTEKFARLDRAQQDNVLQYIDFLSSNNTT